MKPKWRWLIVFLVVAGLVVEVLFDPLSWAVNWIRIGRLRVELPLARARWERAGLKDYQIEVRGSFPMVCIGAARLIMRQDELTQVQSLPVWRSPAPEIYPDPGLGVPGCKYDVFTIAQVLDDLDQLLWRIDPAYTQVKISFDPQYGYVRHYEVNDNYRLGVLTPGVGECCRGFDFENFEVLR